MFKRLRGSLSTPLADHSVNRPAYLLEIRQAFRNVPESDQNWTAAYRSGPVPTLFNLLTAE